MVKNRPKIQKNGTSMLFGALPCNMSNLKVKVVLEFISRDLSIAYFFLFKIPKFNFLPTHEADIRPLSVKSSNL